MNTNTNTSTSTNTNLIRVTLPEGLGEWTGTLAQALKVKGTPAVGVYGMRLSAALSALPEVRKASMDAAELVRLATEQAAKLRALAWWSHNTWDAGWGLRARTLAGSLEGAVKTRAANAPELRAMLGTAELVLKNTAAGGAKRALAAWNKALAEATAAGLSLDDDSRAAVRVEAWRGMFKAWRQRTREMALVEILAAEGEVSAPAATCRPCGPVTLAPAPLPLALSVAGFAPVPDPIHAARAGYRARRNRKARTRRLEAARVRAEARLPRLERSRPVRAAVEAAPCECRSAEDVGHVLAWHAELARRAKLARQSAGSITASGACSCCNMLLPTMLRNTSTDTECPACLALLS